MGEPATHDEKSPVRGRAPAPIPRTPFGKYTLVARLGRGGMAEVDLAYSTGPGGFKKTLVVKRILADLASEPRLVAMFFDEARLAARLSHPHVVQTYEVGEVAGQCFLAMEYLDGQPLHRVLRRCSHRGVRMPTSLVARVVSDALDGLAYAHGLRDFDGTPLGVVHRDVSPQNIFVTYDGVVKMLDFGIAKAGTQIVETRVGAIKGKYAYIAPEQAKGSASVDLRADLWSMGVVLWEALVGRRLFKGDTDLATLDQTLRGPIPRLSDVLKDASPVLDAICARALTRDPAQRYDSASAMREDLERFLRAQPQPIARAELSRYMKKIFAESLDEHSSLLAVVMNDDATPLTGPIASASRTTPSDTPPPSGSVPSDIIPPASMPPPSEATPPPGAAPADPRRRRLAAIALVGAACVAAAVAAIALPGQPEDRADPAPRAVQDARPQRPAGAATVAAPAAGTAAPTVIDAVPHTNASAGDPVLAAEPGVGEGTGTARPGTRRHVRPRLTQRAAAPIVPDPPPDPPPAPPPTGSTGRLTLDTTPWSVVSLDGRQLGTTPLIGAELAAGTYVLVLTNPEQGIRTEYRVRIVAGETTTRRLGIE
jgi:serine/threonine-protein kinase